MPGARPVPLSTQVRRPGWETPVPGEGGSRQDCPQAPSLCVEEAVSNLRSGDCMSWPCPGCWKTGGSKAGDHELPP